MAFFIIFIVFIIGMIIFSASLYNFVVNKRNTVDEAFGGIDVQLKRRFDLIPQTIAAVGRYADHERTLMENLTKWRTEAGRFTVGSTERESLERNIGMGLKALFAVAENYPDLKASRNFLYLQGTLNEVEDNIQAARRFYNAAVKAYNNACEQFPYSLAASMQGIKRKETFTASDTERQPVSVKELFDERGR